MARQRSLLQAMYYGPVIDRTGSSCSTSDLRQPRSPRRRGDTKTQGVPKDVDADQELLFQREEEPAYVVLDVQPRPGCAAAAAAAASCHAGQRPARRRTGGNAIRIFLLAALAAFLAIAVSPGEFLPFLRFYFIICYHFIKFV